MAEPTYTRFGVLMKEGGINVFKVAGTSMAITREKASSILTRRIGADKVIAIAPAIGSFPSAEYWIYNGEIS